MNLENRSGYKIAFASLIAWLFLTLWLFRMHWEEFFDNLKYLLQVIVFQNIKGSSDYRKYSEYLRVYLLQLCNFDTD